MLVGMAAALLVYGMVDTTSAALRRDQSTAAVLAHAKQALIGRAVADDTRPGSLPCPDTDDDGSAELFAGVNCPAYIGRLPWKTLGLPDLRDHTGERLWYALSNNFRDDMSAGPLNSDTQGNRTVYRDSTAVTLTSNAVAVVFAPGTTLAGQNRDGSAALCPTTGATIARNLCAANYLEATGGANNATLAGPYVTAERSATFNDRLLVITAAELMPPVEQRVAREMLRVLNDYKQRTPCCPNWGGTSGCYPWADTSDGESDAAPFNSGSERNRGRIPVINAAPYNWGTNPCGAGALPTMPAWFLNNNWHAIVYYSAARNFLGPNDNGYPCATCVSSMLTVGAASKEAVILMPGPNLGASPRSPVPLNDSSYWQYYLEDAANYDHSDDTYVTPTSPVHTRDRIFTIP
jgi:type II secretory pathway pseudopilin PulG